MSEIMADKMGKRLLVATESAHKLEEISLALKDLPIQVLGIKDIFSQYEAPEETGSTLEENARIKAMKLRSHYPNEWILSDDTGLFVHSLHGAPGVHSARYAEAHNDQANNEKLLKELEEKSDRRAYFSSVFVFITEDKEEVIEGRCDGEILNAPTGSGGFGYDSLFKPDGLNCSFAQLSGDEKNKISHRGKALTLLRERLIDYSGRS